MMIGDLRVEGIERVLGGSGSVDCLGLLGNGRCVLGWKCKNCRGIEYFIHSLNKIQ